MAELENIDVPNDVQKEPQIQNELQPITDKTKVLYDALSPKYKLGTFDEFSKKLQDPAKRKVFYDAVSPTYKLGDYDEFSSKVVEKKNSGTTTSISTGPNSSNISQSESQLPSQQVENDPITLAKQFKDLSKATKKQQVQGFGGAISEIDVPDTEKIDQANKIKSDLKAQGYDEDFINEVSGIPKSVENQQGYTNQELLQLRQNNPNQFHRTVASAKWQTDLKSAMSDAQNAIDADNNLTNEEKIQKKNNINQDWSTIQVFQQNPYTGQEKRNAVEGAIDLVHKYVNNQEEQDNIIKNLVIDKSIDFGSDEAYTKNANNPIMGLAPEQSLALDFLGKTDKSKFLGYQKYLNVDPEEVAKDYNTKLGYDEKLRSLDQIGNTLLFQDAKEEYDKYVGLSKTQQLTPEQQSLAAHYQDKMMQAKQNLSNLDVKYPELAKYDNDVIAQELIGQRTSGIDYAKQALGESLTKAGESIYNVAASPFRNDQEETMAQLQAVGEATSSAPSTYIRQGNQQIQDYKYVLSNDLQDKVDKIKNDKSLSQDEKLALTSKLVAENKDKITRESIDNKFNIGVNSLYYGLTKLGADLTPYILTEALTGGGATAGIARKLASTFSGVLINSYQDVLANAVKNNDPNPKLSAYTNIGINTLAFMVGGIPERIKAAAGTKTAMGQLINKLTDDEILSALRNEPTVLRNFLNNTGKGLVSAAKESTISALKMQPILGAAQLVQGANFDDNFMKQQVIGALNFSLFGTLTGAIPEYNKVKDATKESLYLAGKNSEEALQILDDKIKSGDISKSDADQIRSNIEKAKKVYDKVPMVNAKGEPLNDTDAKNLMFLKLQETDLEDHLNKDLPEDLNKKMSDRLAKVQDDIDKVYKGTFIDDIGKPFSKTKEAEQEVKKETEKVKTEEVTPTKTITEEELKIAPKEIGGLKVIERSENTPEGEPVYKVEGNKYVTEDGKEVKVAEPRAVVTLSGMTEEERNNAIDKRTNDINKKVTPELIKQNKLLQDTRAYFNQPLRDQRKDLYTLNNLRARAQELGLKIDKGSLKQKSTTKGYMGETQVWKRVGHKGIADSDAIIDKTGKTLRDRSQDLQDLFEDFNNRDIFLDFKGSDKRRMSPEQLEATVKDIIDGIPSKRANAYLDVLEDSMRKNEFTTYDKATGEQAGTKEQLTEQEQVGEPMDEDELNSFLNDESNLTPEEEQQLTDNVENLLEDYEPEIKEAGVEGQVQPAKPETEEGVPSEAEQATGTTETESEQQRKTTGTKNAITSQIRSEFNLPSLELPKLGSDAQILAEGKQLVESGEINPKDVVNDILSSKNPKIGADDEKAMLYYMYQLEQTPDLILKELADPKLSDLEKQNLESLLGQVYDDIDAATRANQIRGNVWSKAGNIRQVEIGEDYRPFNNSAERQLLRQTYGGQIPVEVQEKLTKLNEELNQALRKNAEIEERIKEKEAQDKINQIKEKEKTPRAKSDKLDHKNIREKLKEELAKANSEHQEFLKTKGIQQAGLSGITLTPKMVEIIGKIAADYVKEGYEKLEDIIDNVYKEIKGVIPNIDKKDIRDALGLHEAGKIEKRAIKVEEKIKRGAADILKSNYKDKFKNDKEWVKNQQRLTNAQNEFRKLNEEAFNSKLSGYQILLRWVNKLSLSSILTSPTVQFKLGTALVTGAIKRIPEQMFGKIWSGVYKAINEKALIEGSSYARAGAKFSTEFFSPTKFWKNTIALLSNKETPLSKKMGLLPKEDLAELTMPGIPKTRSLRVLKRALQAADITISLPMNSHQAIKDPLKRATYEASYINGIVNAEKFGYNINDPLIVNLIENLAYKRANYEIFLEDNRLSKFLTSQKEKLEKRGELGQTGKAAIDFLIPVSRTATNIVRRIASTSPAGLVRGLYMANRPIEVGKGLYKGGLEGAKDAYKEVVDKLSHEEADAVMRQLKQGSLGTALWIMGWLGYKHLGGLFTKYDPNNKRKGGDLESDQMEVNGQMIPKPIQHGLIFEIPQAAATARRIYEDYRENKGTGSTEALTMAGLGTIGALAEQIPTISEPALLVESTQEPSKFAKFKEQMTRRLKPEFINAQKTDKDKFLEKNANAENLYKNEIKAFDRAGKPRVLSADEFAKYKTELEIAQKKALTTLYDSKVPVEEKNKEGINQAVMKKFVDLTSDEKSKFIKEAKADAKKFVQKSEKFGKERKTPSERRVESMKKTVDRSIQKSIKK